MAYSVDIPCNTWSRARPCGGGGDHATKLTLGCALVWNWVAPPTKAPSASSHPLKQPSAGNRNQQNTRPYSEPAKPGCMAWAAFNKGQCIDNPSHLADHVCSYCLHMVLDSAITQSSIVSKRVRIKWGWLPHLTMDMK